MCIIGWLVLRGISFFVLKRDTHAKPIDEFDPNHAGFVVLQSLPVMSFLLAQTYYNLYLWHVTSQNHDLGLREHVAYRVIVISAPTLTFLIMLGTAIATYFESKPYPTKISNLIF